MLEAEIRLATCRIECGGDTGTGWLVTADNVVTARHCVLDAIDEDREIILTFNPQKASEGVKAKIIDHDENLDICLLSLDKTIEFTPIPLHETQPIGGSRFYSYGWPVNKLLIGHRLEGIVSQVLDTPQLGMDVEVHIDTPAALHNYHGFSGAAFICDGACLGVIRVSVDNAIGVISIARMGNFLRKNRVFIECKSGEEARTHRLASRDDFTREFDAFVSAQSGGYIFIEGAHGIGKSTFCGTYTPVFASIEHFETYSFTSKRGAVNAVQLAQPQEFVNWLNMQVSMFLTQSPGRIAKKDYPDLIKEVERLLVRLGEEYTNREKTGVLFIDGVDEIDKLGTEMLVQFIGLLPQQVPAGLAIVLSAPSYSRLAAILGTRLMHDACLSIPLLASNVTRDFCRQELIVDRANPVTIKLICDRAQGHPLYLRYIIDLVNSGIDDDELATFPLINGNIRNYYEALWNQLQGDMEAVNLLAIAVRLRWGIPMQQFTEILNHAEQAVLVSTIARIKHLLLNPSETTIYHSSFSGFLVEKTQLREQDIQLRLAAYCEKHRNNSYGLINIIHHGLKSEGTANDYVVSLCDQQWVDDCVIDGIEPDILLGDVNLALAAAIELGSLTETVRLLLLTQRLQFRYNTLFAEFADMSANVLISIGKTQEALQHVIRYGRLIIPISEALKVALKLIESSNHHDAIELLNIIEGLIAQKLDSAGNEISIKDFLRLYELQLQQFILKIYAGDQSANEDLFKFQFFWNNYIKTSIQDEVSSKLIRSEMMVYMQTAMMCLSGRYLSIEQISQFYSGPVSELLDPFINAASYYRVLCDDYSLVPDKKLLDHVFADLQKLVSEGWEESKKIHHSTVDNLISVGVPTSVINAIRVEPTKTLPPIKFVAEDNVSFDESLLNGGMVQWRYESFLDPTLTCPTIVTLSPSGWKEGIDSICRIVAWCDGSARRIKESASASGLETVWSVLQQNIFDQLRFTLSHRVTWEEAYALPEAVVPQIYQHLAVLVVDLYPDRMGYLVSFIQDQFASQCGLYSEGFRSILDRVLDHVTRIPLDDDIEDQLFSLIERWRDFVIANLKNRYELVPELLTIVPLFARINASEEALNTYQSVLAFSMGPSWYKEDQFGLMSTALDALNHDVPLESGALSHIAGLLDAAGGEMTFQRFVRYAKRDLIGALCERGDFANAVNYFIRQTYGTSEQLYEEAAQGDIDRISPLIGSRFPGCALDEQDSIWRIVKSAIHVADWQLCWTILEIFQFGDSRHLDNYAETYVLLMQKAIGDRDVTIEMMKRLELVCESEVERSQRLSFLSSVERHLPTELKGQFESLFGVYHNFPNTSEPRSVQINSDYIENKNGDRAEERQLRDAFLMPGVFGTKESIQKAQDALTKAKRLLHRRNCSEAQKEVIDGIEIIQSAGWPIWGNQIKEVSEGIELLLQTTKSPSDLVKLCYPLILNERYAETWRIASSLIEWFAKGGTHDEKAALARLVIEHTEIMVGAADYHVKNYEFLEKEQETDISYSLIKLILHAIDHPTWLRSEKAAEMLLWLLRNDSQYIPIFGPKAFSMESKNHPDVLCGVFDQLSRSNSKQLWEKLAPALDFDKIRQDCKHVGRLSVLIRIANRAAQRESDTACQALSILQENIPDTVEVSEDSQKNEVECPPWAEVIKFQWYRLKKIGLVNSQIVECATSVLKEQCLPFSFETNMELEQILTQGFGWDYNRPGRWKAKVSFAFQVALLPVTTKALLTKIEEIFRPYNPSRLDNIRITGVSSLSVDWLTQLKKGTNTIKPINGRYIYLDFYERVWFEDRWNSFRFTAYFYESGKKPQSVIPSGRFFSTEEPTSDKASCWDTCANVKGLPAYFGSFTPAVASSTFMKVTRSASSDLVRAYWKSGRVPESIGGGPEHEGCYLAIDRNALRLPNGLKLAWVYEIDGEHVGIVTPT